MKHLKKHLMMTLALLLTAATSAWAESKPIGLNVEYEAGDVITTNSTGDVYVWWGIYSTGGENYEWLIKITSSVTPTISKLVIVESSGSIKLDKDYALYDMNGNQKAYSYSIQCQGEVTGTTLEKVYVASGSGTLTDPYVFAPGPAASGNAFPITWIATSPNTASIAAMPAGNVTVNVKYFAQAEFAESIGPTPELLAPAAIAGVPANTDAPIVTAGTVANIGTSEVKQGTLMYFVKQADGNTAPAAPDYDDDGWSENVPTADRLAEGKAFVWYYIKGAEPANIADRTDDNTRSDSDIKPLGTNGVVTLAAEPTYDVTLNDEGLSTDEAAAWKVAKGTDDPAAFPLKGVKKGDKVTVTYSGSKKVLGVKAEKKKAVTDLSTLTEGYEAQNGDVLIGTLNGAQKITIADGATVTLAGVTINGVHSDWYKYAGITCLGDATIILKDGTTNKVTGFDGNFPGIQGAAGKTLTITGTGSLYASCDVDGSGAGIGSASYSNNNPARACGNIVIEGGTITAVGGYAGAGIGSGSNASCGNITIKSTVAHVTATKGKGAPDSIGAGKNGSCGTKTIEDSSKVTQN